jgi:hypothetical protein
LKVTVFWDITQYGPIEVDRRFRGAYTLHHQADRPIETRFHIAEFQKSFVFVLVAVRRDDSIKMALKRSSE